MSEYPDITQRFEAEKIEKAQAKAAEKAAKKASREKRSQQAAAQQQLQDSARERGRVLTKDSELVAKAAKRNLVRPDFKPSRRFASLISIGAGWVIESHDELSSGGGESDSGVSYNGTDMHATVLGEEGGIFDVNPVRMHEYEFNQGRGLGKLIAPREPSRIISRTTGLENLTSYPSEESFLASQELLMNFVYLKYLNLD